MRHLLWRLDGFDTVPRLPPSCERRRAAQQTRYPIRYLRYWFGRSALAEQHARLARPLSVLEVGIDRGEMLCFMGGPPVAAARYALPPWIARWDALDVHVDRTVIGLYGYSDHIEANVEADDVPWRGERTYDAIIVSHVLEHLHDPEAAMRRLLAQVVSGGILVGGSPTMPSALTWLHERQLKRRASDAANHHAHRSVITPGRVRRFARAHGVAVDLLAGAFLVRASGSPLENHATWIRANLLWGALFPALGGEIYFSLRVPDRMP